MYLPDISCDMGGRDRAKSDYRKSEERENIIKEVKSEWINVVIQQGNFIAGRARLRANFIHLSCWHRSNVSGRGAKVQRTGRSNWKIMLIDSLAR